MNFVHLREVEQLAQLTTWYLNVLTCKKKLC